MHNTVRFVDNNSNELRAVLLRYCTGFLNGKYLGACVQNFTVAGVLQLFEAFGSTLHAFKPIFPQNPI